MSEYKCNICGYETGSPDEKDIGSARGNTERFKDAVFKLWKCPECLSIHTLGEVDFEDVYKDYPLNNRRLDIFAKGTMSNLLSRLRKAGLRKGHRILDYGCGNGLFVEFLRQKGYRDILGFDPYVPEFAHLDDKLQFDVIVSNDVIEHSDDPKTVIGDCKKRLKEGGILYIGGPDSTPIDMRDLEPHLMTLHLPFHRTLFNKEALKRICKETDLEIIQTYTRSYMDTIKPFANYRFLHELNKAVGHSMDKTFESTVTMSIFKNPILLFYGLFGYFFPTAYEPAVIARKGERV